MSNNNNTLQNLLESVVTANTNAELALVDFTAGLQATVDTPEEKTNISIKSNLTEAFRLRGKISEYYDASLVELDALGVPWEKITLHLQTITFAGEYPLQESGKPVRMQIARTKCDAGRYINCFNSYRNSRYSNYGIEKLKTTKVVSKTNKEILDGDTHTTERVEAKEALQTVKKEESKTALPSVFSKADVPVALTFIYKLLEESDSLEALTAVETLADHFQVEL